MVAERTFRCCTRAGVGVAIRAGAALVLSALSAVAFAQVPADAFAYERTVAYTYTATGQVSTETVEPDGESCMRTVYAYDTFGNRATSASNQPGTTLEPCASTKDLQRFAARKSTVSYGAHTGRIGSAGGDVVDVPAGAFATRATNALGHAETRVLDPRFGAPVSVQGPNGLTTTFAYDALGRVVSETAADGTVLATHYCALSTTFHGVSIDTTLNTPGCPTPAEGEAPADAVRFEQRVRRAADGGAIGALARVYFDRAGRTLRQVTEGYVPPGSAAAPPMVYQDTVYDRQGMAVVATQPYFADRLSSTANGRDDVGLTQTRYDAMGRPVEVLTTDPATTSSAGGSQANVGFGRFGLRRAASVVVSYQGSTVTWTDDRGGTRREQRSPTGKVLRSTDEAGAQVAYEYDAFDNLVATKDALQNVIRAAFDVRGRRVRLDDPDAGVTVNCFDALGQLKAQQRSNQRRGHTPAGCPSVDGSGTSAPTVDGWTTFAHDLLGRLVDRLEPEYRSSWAYDDCPTGVGKLCASWTSHGVSRWWRYDERGRPKSLRTDVAGGPAVASSVNYDARTGRVSSQTYPTGLQVGFEYSGQGVVAGLKLLSAVTLNPLPAVKGGLAPAAATVAAGTWLWRANTVDAWGHVTSAVTASGVESTMAFDAQTGRVTQVRAVDAAKAIVAEHRYVWDSLGRMTSRVDAVGDGSGVESLDTFAYDAVGRLVLSQVSGGSPSAPSVRTVRAQYNAAGMVLARTDAGNFSYPAAGVANGRPHAVLRVDGIGARYAYDLNGNAISATDGAWRSIGYTSFDLPDATAGVLGANGTRLTWQYDEQHQRIREDRRNSAGTRTTWYFHPDNRGGLAFEREVAADGAQHNRHYLSVSGATLAVLVTAGPLPPMPGGVSAPTAQSQMAAVKLEYWHRDVVGSLIATTDHRGAVTARYAYDAFGKRRFTNTTYDAFGTLIVDWSTELDRGTDRGFTGHEHLDDVGLVHMNGRLYDPRLGRFLQADPFVQDPLNLQNFDRYGYCFNNPLTCTDPSGQKFSLKRFVASFLLDLVCPICGAAYRLNMIAHTKLGYQVLSLAINVGCMYMGGGPVCVGLGQATLSAVAGHGIDASIQAGIRRTVSAGMNTAIGGISDPLGNALAHAAWGCVEGQASGGGCGAGARGAATEALLSPNLPTLQGQDWSALAVNTMIRASIGGLAAVAGGGDFWQGAQSAGLSYLFNQAMHAARTGAAAAAGGAAAGGAAVVERIALAIDQAAARVGDVLDYIFKSDSVVLARNMVQDTDLQREPGQHAHHIVAANDPRAAPGRAVLDAVKMDINSAFNGIFLDPSQHARIHTNVYYNAVNAGLAGATTYGDVALRLTAMRVAIQSGIFPR